MVQDFIVFLYNFGRAEGARLAQTDSYQLIVTKFLFFDAFYNTFDEFDENI